MTANSFNDIISRIPSGNKLTIVVNGIASRGTYSSSSITVRIKKEDVLEVTDEIAIVHCMNESSSITMERNKDKNNTMFIPLDNIVLVWAQTWTQQ